MIHYINVETGAIYRAHGVNALRWFEDKATWRKSTKIRACDLIHYPFIGIRK